MCVEHHKRAWKIPNTNHVTALVRVTSIVRTSWQMTNTKWTASWLQQLHHHHDVPCRYWHFHTFAPWLLAVRHLEVYICLCSCSSSITADTGHNLPDNVDIMRTSNQRVMSVGSLVLQPYPLRCIFWTGVKCSHWLSFYTLNGFVESLWTVLSRLPVS